MFRLNGKRGEPPASRCFIANSTIDGHGRLSPGHCHAESLGAKLIFLLRKRLPLTMSNVAQMSTLRSSGGEWSKLRNYEAFGKLLNAIAWLESYQVLLDKTNDTGSSHQYWAAIADSLSKVFLK